MRRVSTYSHLASQSTVACSPAVSSGQDISVSNSKQLINREKFENLLWWSSYNTWSEQKSGKPWTLPAIERRTTTIQKQQSHK